MEYGSGTMMFDELPVDVEDWFRYSVGERIDLDNDGENEQIIDGSYGGIYFDVKDGKVYVLADGNGTVAELSYTNYDNAVWVALSKFFITTFPPPLYLVNPYICLPTCSCLYVHYWEKTVQRWIKKCELEIIIVYKCEKGVL